MKVYFPVLQAEEASFNETGLSFSVWRKMDDDFIFFLLHLY